MSSPEVAADGKAGFLKKKAGKGPHGFKQWKRKWVLLDAGALSWADSPSAKEKGRIVLDSAWLVRISDPNAGRLEVGDEKELLALQAADVAEARGWVDALQAVRTRRTSRWEDRMLARVGASAGDRERLRAVCETWQDGHLTVVRERAAETGSADAVETAAAAAAAAAGGAVGACASAGAAASVASSGQRLWCVLDRATLWLSAGPRTASTPLGYVALESVETIRSLPGQRSLALLTERGASLTVTADTRKELLQWNLAIARAHSAARHLLRAQVLRRIDTAAQREPAGPPRPPPPSAHAAMAAERAAKALAAGVAVGADGRPLPGAVPDGGVLLTPQQAGVVSGTRCGCGGHAGGGYAFDDAASARSGHEGGGCGHGASPLGGGGCNGVCHGSSSSGVVELHQLRGGLHAGAGGGGGYGSDDGASSVRSGNRARGGSVAGGVRGGPGAASGGGLAAAAEAGDDGDDDAGLAAWGAELRLRRSTRAPGLLGACSLCLQLPASLLYYLCVLCPTPVRKRTHRTLRNAEERARTAGQQALHTATEAAHVVDSRLLGGAGGTASAAIGSALLSLADEDDFGLGDGLSAAEPAIVTVPLIERRSEEAEMRIDSIRDLANRHLRFKAALVLCGQRVPISNRWAKKVLGMRVSAETEAELWTYARNLGKVAAMHARATAQPMGGGHGQRVLRPPPRLANAALGALGSRAAARHAAVPLAHFIMLSHTLPLVPPSGKFFNLETLAAEAACAEVETEAAGGGGGLGPGGSYADGSSLGGDGGEAFGGLNAAALAADSQGQVDCRASSFVSPLINCRDPAACKDAFFKAVPALQKALSPIHRAKDAELDDSEALKIAAQIANMWQDVLDAGGGPATVTLGSR